MGTAYFNKEDVIKRLHNTICFYDGQPYIVDASTVKENEVKLLTFDQINSGVRSELIVDYTSDKFNYKSPRLGYMFHKKQSAVYISRLPDRNQSQGLNTHVLHTQPELNRYHSQWYFSKEFEDMLLNRYPSRSNAESLLSSGMATSVPISRNVALAHSRRGLLEIFYKGRPVACNLKGRGIELYDITERSYMAKLLANDGVLLG